MLKYHGSTAKVSEYIVLSCHYISHKPTDRHAIGTGMKNDWVLRLLASYQSIWGYRH